MSKIFCQTAQAVLDVTTASEDKDTVLNNLRAYHTNALNAMSAEGIKVRKVAKNRNRYNQVPHLTQNT